MIYDLDSDFFNQSQIPTAVQTPESDGEEDELDEARSRKHSEHKLLHQKSFNLSKSICKPNKKCSFQMMNKGSKDMKTSRKILNFKTKQIYTQEDFKTPYNNKITLKRKASQQIEMVP